MLNAYGYNLDLLAMDLEILFESCTDATFAVLHNVAIDKIMALCGEEIDEKDELGLSANGKRIALTCKTKLARQVAQAVLRYARSE
jgi:hypothetical protein